MQTKMMNLRGMLYLILLASMSCGDSVKWQASQYEELKANLRGPHQVASLRIDDVVHRAGAYGDRDCYAGVQLGDRRMVVLCPCAAEPGDSIEILMDGDRCPRVLRICAGASSAEQSPDALSATRHVVPIGLCGAWTFPTPRMAPGVVPIFSPRHASPELRLSRSVIVLAVGANGFSTISLVSGGEAPGAPSNVGDIAGLSTFLDEFGGLDGDEKWIVDSLCNGFDGKVCELSALLRTLKGGEQRLRIWFRLELGAAEKTPPGVRMGPTQLLAVAMGSIGVELLDGALSSNGGERNYSFDASLVSQENLAAEPTDPVPIPQSLCGSWVLFTEHDAEVVSNEAGAENESIIELEKNAIKKFQMRGVPAKIGDLKKAHYYDASASGMPEAPISYSFGVAAALVPKKSVPLGQGPSVLVAESGAPSVDYDIEVEMSAGDGSCIKLTVTRGGLHIADWLGFSKEDWRSLKTVNSTMLQFISEYEGEATEEWRLKVAEYDRCRGKLSARPWFTVMQYPKELPLWRR